MTTKGIINISGISESRVAPIAARIIKEKKGQCLIVVSSDIRAKRLTKDLSFFMGKNVYELPGEEDYFLRYEARDHEQLLRKLKVLNAVQTEEECIVVAPVTAVVKKMSPHSSFEESSFGISFGEDVDPEKIKSKLAAMGYERLPLVDGRGQFSIRGSIIDIFTPDGEFPYRIELFDTEVDSLRTFDIVTQRSIENLQSVRIFQAEQILKREDIFSEAVKKIEKAYDSQIKKLLKKEVDPEITENLETRKNQLTEYADSGINLQQLENYICYFYDEPEKFIDYMNEPTVMVDDPNNVYRYYEDKLEEFKYDFKTLLENGQVVPGDSKNLPVKNDFLQIYDEIAETSPVYIFTPFQNAVKGVRDFAEFHDIPSKQTIAFNGRMDILEKELISYAKRGYEVTIVCANEERLTNMNDFLERHGLRGKVKLEIGSLTGGMEFPSEKTCYIWDGDIFVSQKKKRSRKRHKNIQKGEAIKSFADMKKGDYVVHENHGIGKFIGIEQLTVQGAKKDYLKLKYAGSDMLYIPVEQMDIIQKYVGADTAAPKLSKLSGSEWKVTKAKAKAAIANMAKELLEVSAARQMEKGYKFGPDTNWQEEFEASFPYTETPDQLRSIEEIKGDMEKSVAMDRLLCGDVGFGKTEVAARAMFKCAAEGKQAAVLVPTTILANQHYYTLKERFERFPFKVEMLSRFRNEKQQEEIADGLRKGSIDVVIGTHRLLSKDIKFKDLGLLVIDEEQRFGVKHKEVIKQIRKNVDVLTLSATPIPRTLHMSLVGIKDMSLIEEPPEDRYPVQTYVSEQDDVLIRDAIEKELARDGQVYVVYNRVRGINKIAAKIEKMVPEARVSIGHGQMNERHLEDVVLDFVNKESNVLVATTIIESGIDIPNVNTMLIMDADRYGLSQLYQLRGRVGRSNRLAYAYLMYQKDKSLSEIAEKRLRAIKEFTEFGAGFKVAMRDLEIRGAGNLLGTEQHGHMMNIGYELYCKLVDDAVRALDGQIVNPDREEPSIEINVTALIPDRYISDEMLKLQMYKKIAAVRDADEEAEIIDELIDRFGEIPKETLNLMKISRIKGLAIENEIARVVQKGNKISFYVIAGGGPKAENLAFAADKFGMRLFIHGGVEPVIRYTVEGRDMLSEVVEVLETFKTKA